MSIFRVTLGPTVKEACPVGSFPATMEVAAHSLLGGRVALACQGMVVPNVSTAVMMAAPPSPAVMEVCAPKKQVSRTSTASVPMAGRVNGASRVADPLPSQHPHVL